MLILMKMDLSCGIVQIYQKLSIFPQLQQQKYLLKSSIFDDVEDVPKDRTLFSFLKTFEH